VYGKALSGWSFTRISTIEVGAQGLYLALNLARFFLIKKSHDTQWIITIKKIKFIGMLDEKNVKPTNTCSHNLYFFHKTC
jgi:hypothetical protein